MKTTYGSGVIVTSEWLNGAKDIRFDGQDLDWHYNPLGLESLVLKGPNGLDSRYVTLGTDQPSLTVGGVYITGFPISGDKVATGKWTFGFDETQNPAVSQDFLNAPGSFLTNLKYNYANGVTGPGGPSVAAKFEALGDEDLITKLVLRDVLSIIDNGSF